MHRPRSKAIEGVRFVLRTQHQARESELHALGGISFEDETVERVECKHVLIEEPCRRNMRKYSALLRIWIDIIEILEVRGIFEIAER